MRNDIVFLGPMGSGKTTIAQRLSEITSMQYINIDAIKWTYFERLGYEEKKANFLLNSDGIKGLYNYYKRFEIIALLQIFQEYKSCVFDLGAGFAVYEAENDKEKFFSCLNSFNNVFLMLPHKDYNKSLLVLNQRMSQRFKKDIELEGILKSTKDFDLNVYFLNYFFQHGSLFNIIYTYRKKISETADEIISKLNLCELVN